MSLTNTMLHKRSQTCENILPHLFDVHKRTKLIYGEEVKITAALVGIGLQKFSPMHNTHTQSTKTSEAFTELI